MIWLQNRFTLTFPDKLIKADQWLMLKINREWSHPFLDNFSLFMREPLVHVPLYLFLALFLIINFGKSGFWWMITALAMAGVNDILSSQLIKEFFDRPRPCRDETIAHQIRFIAKYCGMNGSFISSHASSHFAVATFIYFTLRSITKWFALAFLWAAGVCYAQVYVGVHYPFDVFCGAVFGIAIGFATAALYNKKIFLVNPAR